MKRSLLRKALIAAGFFAILTAVGVFLFWHIAVEHLTSRLASQYIANIAAESHIVSIEKIGEMRIKKQFPYINIYLDKLYLKENKINVHAENISDKISILKAAAAYLMHRKYYGDISINSLYTDIKSFKSSKKFTSISIIMPLNIHIKNADIVFNGHRFKGLININYNTVLNKNNIYLKGRVDSSRIKVYSSLRKQTISSRIDVNLGNLNLYGIKRINGSFKLNNFKELTFDLNVDRIRYKGINILKPYFSGNIIKKDNNNFDINNINISSENGFFIYLNGGINIKHIANSSITGSISTPFINMTPLIPLIPVKNINQYAKSANIKIKKLEFSGGLSLKNIKTGIIYAENAQFRISKNTDYFHVKQALVNISLNDIKITTEGTFSSMKFRDSKLTIHRMRGYPCDMDLHYYGFADNSANKFLKNAIFPKDDWKLLGNAANIRGYIDAATLIKGYRWSSKPFFDFDIVINAKDVSFDDNNIPQKFIRAGGNVEIKREISFGKIKNMYVRLKNIDAKTKTSHITTPLSTIYLHPLRFEGAFSTNISKSDFTFLESHLLDKMVFTPQGKIHITGKLKGSAGKFGYSAHILPGYSILSRNLSIPAIYISGNFNKGILNIKKLSMKKDEKKILEIKGSADVKKFSYSLLLNAVDLEIPYIFTFISPQSIFLKDGYLNGKAKISGGMDKISRSSGSLVLKNGYISDRIKDINFKSKFNNEKLNIDNGQCIFMGNKISFNASILFTGNNSISANVKADKFKIDYEKLKANKNSGGFHIKLPQINANINCDIKTLNIQNPMNDVTLKNVHIDISNDTDISNFKLNSNNTNISINIRKHKNGSDLSIHIKDDSLFAQLTKYDRKDNKFELDSTLHSDSTKLIDAENLYGKVGLKIKNGSFKGMPHIYKILAATNITQILIGKVKFKKDFKYKTISGYFDIKNGVIKTQPDKALIARGEDVDIFTTGKYEIFKNYIDIYTIFTTFRGINKIISSIPLIGWIIGGKEKSFTGVAFHIKGNIDSKLSVKPIPLKNIGKGVIDIIKRTITLPIHIFGVK